MGTPAEHPSLGVMHCFPPSLASALQRSLGRKCQGLMTEHGHLLITPVVENLQLLYFREKGYIPIQNVPPAFWAQKALTSQEAPQLVGPSAV